jgi:hypothetical protein
MGSHHNWFSPKATGTYPSEKTSPTRLGTNPYVHTCSTCVRAIKGSPDLPGCWPIRHALYASFITVGGRGQRDFASLAARSYLQACGARESRFYGENGSLILEAILTFWRFSTRKGDRLEEEFENLGIFKLKVAPGATFGICRGVAHSWDF